MPVLLHYFSLVYGGYNLPLGFMPCYNLVYRFKIIQGTLAFYFIVSHYDTLNYNIKWSNPSPLRLIALLSLDV